MMIEKSRVLNMRYVHEIRFSTQRSAMTLDQNATIEGKSQLNLMLQRQLATPEVFVIRAKSIAAGSDFRLSIIPYRY